MMTSRALLLLGVLGLAAGLPAVPAMAQTDETAAEPAAPKKKAKDQSELEVRVQQLERQILDMQVVIGTLESMARQGDGSSNAALGTDQDARITALETQLQALTAEVQSLGGQAVSSTSVPAAPATDAGEFAATTPDEVTVDTGDLTLGDADTAAPGDPIGNILLDGGTSSGGEVDPAAGDGIAASDLGTLDGSDSEPAAPPAAETDVAALPATTPEQAFQEAYGHLLQQDFAAAESGFTAFLKTYPKSKLAGNAQYWLGETHYVRGNYKEAADAFLTGYKNFRKGQKAPDSLMKLAMSLSRLGEKDAACSAFAALENDFPKLQAQLRRRAEAERQRAGC